MPLTLKASRGSGHHRIVATVALRLSFRYRSKEAASRRGHSRDVAVFTSSVVSAFEINAYSYIVFMLRCSFLTEKINFLTR